MLHFLSRHDLAHSYLPYHRLRWSSARLLLAYLSIGARNGQYSEKFACQLAGIRTKAQHDRARQELIDLGFLIVRPTLLGYDEYALLLDTPSHRVGVEYTRLNNTPTPKNPYKATI
jgi:hypothetical protein